MTFYFVDTAGYCSFFWWVWGCGERWKENPAVEGMADGKAMRPEFAYWSRNSMGSQVPGKKSRDWSSKRRVGEIQMAGRWDRIQSFLSGQEFSFHKSVMESRAQE